MKTNAFRRGISFLFFFVLAACQASSNTPVPTSTVFKLSPEIETTIVHVGPTPTVSATSKPETPAGEIAYTHVEAISEGIGPRVTGTAAEAQTARYIVLEFERLRYISELHPFRVNGIDSANVIALKPGLSSREIIVGAHYDSAGVGKGADDNAAGVGVILEVAKRIQDQKTPYTIRFILFGAEEIEMQGSAYHVSQMTEAEIQNTVAMINLDSLAAGDIAYVYGDEGERGVIRDWTLNFAQEHGLTLQTQLGENRTYPPGTTGDWSDFVSFKDAGIPYAYFESTNWTLGDQDGYTQVRTEYGENGQIWHTKYDTLEYINKTFPGRMQQRLKLYVTLLEAILTQFEPAK